MTGDLPEHAPRGLESLAAALSLQLRAEDEDVADLLAVTDDMLTDLDAGEGEPELALMTLAERAAFTVADPALPVAALDFLADRREAAANLFHAFPEDHAATLLGLLARALLDDVGGVATDAALAGRRTGNGLPRGAHPLLSDAAALDALLLEDAYALDRLERTAFDRPQPLRPAASLEELRAATRLLADRLDAAAPGNHLAPWARRRVDALAGRALPPAA